MGLWKVILKGLGDFFLHFDLALLDLPKLCACQPNLNLT